MPVRYTTTGNLLRMDLEGTYTPEEIVNTYNAALDDPACPPRPHFMFDVRRSAALAERDSEVIRSVAEYLGEHSDRVGNRCAIVATKPVHFGLSRMAATIAEMRGADVQVFSSSEDALSWLTGASKTGAGEGTSEHVPE